MVHAIGVSEVHRLEVKKDNFHLLRCEGGLCFDRGKSQVISSEWLTLQRNICYQIVIFPV
jgi:hypothetical protein